MKTKRVYNATLVPKQTQTGTIEIIKFNEENLLSLGWVDSNGYPTEIMEKFFIDMENIIPTTFEKGAKYWDQIRKGYSFYNHFFEDGNT